MRLTSLLVFAGHGDSDAGRRSDGTVILARAPSSLRAVTLSAAVLEDRDELHDESPAARGCPQRSVDEDRRDRLLQIAGQRDADVGVLRFAGSVDDAAMVSWPARAPSHRSHEICDFAAGRWYRIGANQRAV